MILSLSIVLILVVMEYGLRPTRIFSQIQDSLNPCCNGIWSQTQKLFLQPRQGRSQS